MKTTYTCLTYAKTVLEKLMFDLR